MAFLSDEQSRYMFAGSNTKHTKMARKQKQVKRQKKKITFSKRPPVAAAELGFIAKALRGLGGLAGGTFAGQAGSLAGHNLGAQVSRWLGQGDYSVSTNSITSRIAAGSPAIPMVHGTGQSIVVRHKEYLTDVVGGAINTFNVSRGFSLNPGIEESFPWLSTIAQQFQEYSIKGMVFHFESNCADSTGSTVPTLGSFMMGTQYKSTSAPYTNKTEMLNEYFSSSVKCSENSVHPIECDPKENPYNVQYVRGGPIPAGEDLKTYDLGTFYYATHGLQVANVTIGELWVTYEIELRKPAVNGLTSVYDNVARYSLTGAAPGAYLGTSRVASFDSVGLTFGSNSSFTFPMGTVGDYYLTLYYMSAATAYGMATSTTNCTVVANFYGGATNIQTNATSGTYIFLTTVAITDPNKQATVVFNTGTVTGTPFGELIVAQVNPAAW